MGGGEEIANEPCLFPFALATGRARRRLGAVRVVSYPVAFSFPRCILPRFSGCRIRYSDGDIDFQRPDDERKKEKEKKKRKKERTLSTSYLVVFSLSVIKAIFIAD